MPSARFAANGAWLAVQVMAHNLARWTARIGLGERTVTHGPLLPLLLFLLASGIKPVPIRLFVMGFSLGVAVHLCFDLFPKAWQGYALIHVPVVGWTYPLVSWVWIALSIICCLYMAMRLVRNGLQGMALVFGMLGLFGYAGVNEEAVWAPLLSIIAATVIGLVVLLWRTSPADR